MPAALARIDVTVHELELLLAQAKDAPLSEEAYQRLLAAIHTLAHVAHLLHDEETTLRRLRQLLFGPTTETTRQVLTQIGVEPNALPRTPSAPPRSVPGHGRHGADAYTGARKVHIPHPALKPGDRCPKCVRGKVYAQDEPGVLVRFVGQAPLGATVYELDKLRCNLYGEIFTADPPAGVGPEKYDATATGMIALLKYGSGVPFNRIAELQGALGIPLPPATAWEIVAAAAPTLRPALDELIRQAAQGAVLHNDDTRMRILTLPPAADVPGDAAVRTGTFTSGIVATRENQRIALFFTGRQHAGENLAAVLARRAAELGPPIQMCDALARNLPKPLEVILGHCLAHGRRQFVDVAPNFPGECRHVLESLAAVYRHDDLAREQALSSEDRLRFHQTHSGPVMTALHAWLTAQLDEKHAEPNSGLGKAIGYLVKHWQALTLFLRQPGAPLDNNICERALKKAILHRKNAYFYKTVNGAQVGDLYMSLIHTCELCGANPFDYLAELQRHATELAQTPSQWMPWNYRETLARAGGSGSEHGPSP
jgi:transposase